ncbi:hypothetical protein HYX14_00065 [Candidatus Woesearchaeota archaeon]|nr:hypothetical protein [Candidatus Woesearchaeota archaeon]
MRLDEKEIQKALAVGKKYHFHKEGHRLYQINVPMDLRALDWEFLGKIVLIEFTVGYNRTEGTFILVKEFSDEDREVFTKAYVSDEEVENVLNNQA